MSDEQLLLAQPARPGPAGETLSLGEALRVQSAEYWLTLGESDQALAELEQLPECARSHARVLKVWVAALGAARSRQENQQ